MKRCLPLLVTWLILAAGIRADDITRFSQGLAPVERREAGIERLSSDQIAIMDALKMFPGPIIELHITNIHRREAIYHNSLVSKVATAVMAYEVLAQQRNNTPHLRSP